MSLQCDDYVLQFIAHQDTRHRACSLVPPRPFGYSVSDSRVVCVPSPLPFPLDTTLIHHRGHN